MTKKKGKPLAVPTKVPSMNQAFPLPKQKGKNRGKKGC